MSPPEAGVWRGCSRWRNVNAREDGFEAIVALDDSEVEELELRRCEDLVLGPVDAVLTFSVSVNEVVGEIGAGNVPELPFAVVEEEIRFVDASLLPGFVGDEDGRGLINPVFAVPFEEADRVGSPKLISGTCIVDAFDPIAALRIPAFDIGGTVAAAAAIPNVAFFVAAERGDAGGIVIIGGDGPAGCGEGRTEGERGAEKVRGARRVDLAGQEHVPAVVAVGKGGVGEFDDVGQGRKAVRWIEDFGFADRGWEVHRRRIAERERGSRKWKSRRVEK